MFSIESSVVISYYAINILAFMSTDATHVLSNMIL